MGHSIGISDSYYKITEDELLNDYLKAVEYLTISKEEELKKEVDQLVTNHSNKENEIKSRLFNKEQENSLLTATNNSNTDAIAALSERVIELTKEMDRLKARLPNS